MRAKDLIELHQAQGRVWRNYIVPGLDSYLLCGDNGRGFVRLFVMRRLQETVIVPHNHRYDFHCQVLAGDVTHRTYELGEVISAPRQDTTHAIMGYNPASPDRTGDVFAYTNVEHVTDEKHNAGDTYELKYKDFHTVMFAKGAEVLFFEGPSFMRHTSKYLVPYDQVNKAPLDTYYWRDWMMKR